MRLIFKSEPVTLRDRFDGATFMNLSLLIARIAAVVYLAAGLGGFVDQVYFRRMSEIFISTVWNGRKK